MKVILTQDIKGTGKKDQMIEVSDGFARNYLFPKKLAVEANAQNRDKLEAQKSAEARKKAQAVVKAQETAKHLKSLSVTVRAKSGRDGKLFGSVTSKEISEAIKREHDIDVDRRKIQLVEPIKTLGEFEVAVHIYQDIPASIKVNVVAAE